jgi:hypothetical protein
MHLTLEDHDADPPSAWRVVRIGPRCWHLDTSLPRGGTIGYYGTRRDAERGKVDGPYVTLYEREGRWMRGQTPAGWRPYAEVAAERAAREAKQAARVAEAAAQLARFDHYPPEPNGRNGYCLVDGGYLAIGQGVICLGHDNGGTFAAPLHKQCAELVDAWHKRQDADRAVLRAGREAIERERARVRPGSVAGR